MLDARVIGVLGDPRPARVVVKDNPSGQPEKPLREVLSSLRKSSRTH
jgi:hypothetical protein